MPRRLRLHVPGGFYHVTLRGNHRQPIFFRDADRELLDQIVAESLEHCICRLHAYCWMTNHLHMLVQVSHVPLRRLILRIASAYARTVQLRLETTGHLFERRHHALLVDADRYLLTLVRYIHLNPVRAGLVADPSAYAWSSHRAYLGLRLQPWVTTNFALRVLASNPESAIANYRRFMGEPEPLQWGNGTLIPHGEHPHILGDDDFVNRMVGGRFQPTSRRTLHELLQECSDRFGITPDALVSPVRTRKHTAARAWLGHAATSLGIASISSVARLLGRTESAIRQVMCRHPADVGAAQDQEITEMRILRNLRPGTE